MKSLIIASLVVLSCIDVAVAGRFSLFSHKDSRSKMFRPHKVVVIVTGRESGLMLQYYPKAKEVVTMPKGKSFVVDPIGNKVFLEFPPPQAGSIFWRGKFVPPLQRVQGIYTYHITFTVDGQPYDFKHRIDYSFDFIEGLSFSSKQEDGRKKKPENKG